MAPLRGDFHISVILFFCEAEQRFLLLFLEKEEYHERQLVGPIGFWGQPQTPWLRFAEILI
jgi:hypothetical protein